MKCFRQTFMKLIISSATKIWSYRRCRFYLLSLISLLILTCVVINLSFSSHSSVLTPSELFLSQTEQKEKIKPLDAALVYRYPLAIDMVELVYKSRRGFYIPYQEINPVNTLQLNFYPRQRKAPCFNDTLLILLIKSAVSHFEERNYIRKTWSRTEAWRNNSVRHIFVLGSPDSRLPNCSFISLKLELETLLHDDVIVFNFIDNYYNNTMKMMSSIDWASRICSEALFYVFVDDDFYINPRVIVNHLQTVSPYVYHRYFLGYNYPYAIPIRTQNKLDDRRKWFVNYKDYPFELYPSYVAAGFFILSRPVLRDISIAMRYIKHLRFDDVFLGIVVRKLLLVPLHHDGIANSINDIPDSENGGCRKKLTQMMAVHMEKRFSPKMLVRLWWSLEHHMDNLEKAQLTNRSLT